MNAVRTGGLCLFLALPTLQSAGALAAQDFDKQLASKLAAIRGWRGFYEVRASGNPSMPSANLRQNEAARESSSFGTFELVRDRSDGSWWDPGRGMFEWSGNGEVRASHHATRTQWAMDGSGYQLEFESGGRLGLKRVGLVIALGTHMARFHNGELSGDLAAKQTGYGQQSRYDHQAQAFVLARQPMDREFRMGPLLPMVSRLQERTWVPIDLFPQVGGGAIAAHSDYPFEDTLPSPAPVRCQEQLLLVPIYDDVEVEVTIDGYSQWLPKGSFDDPKRPGSGLIAHAVLKSKTGKPADLPDVDRFRFELIDTSREPGVCMNWPFQAEDHDYDLRFADFTAEVAQDRLASVRKFFSDWGLMSMGDYDLANMPAGGVPAMTFGTVTDNGQQAELVEPPKDKAGQPFAEAAMECFDFGAKSELRVTCILKDGRALIGLLKGADGVQDLVRLPKRMGPDWVAERWRRENDAVDLAATDDTEKVAGNSFVGDGYTLYEEYRGFLLNGRHWQGDPKRRDLIVWNLLGADGRAGIRLFGRGAQLHVMIRDGDRERHGGPPFESRADLPMEERLMNGNHRDAPHHVDQHGLFLWDRFIYRGGGSVMTDPEYLAKIGLPRTTWWVAVEPRDCDNSLFGDRYGAWFKLTPRDAGLAYERAVAHELLHAVGVKHHGYAPSLKYEVYFQAASDPWNPTGAPRFTWLGRRSQSDFGTSTSIDSAYFGGADQTVTLLWEDTQQSLAVEAQQQFDQRIGQERANVAHSAIGGNLVGRDEAFWRETWAHREAERGLDKSFHAGLDQGTDSGNELCIMRYYFATAYAIPGRTNAWYVMRPGSNHAGRELCTSPAGTGGNAADHQPKPRFGDAFAGNGNCFSQVCVNDSYPDRQER